MALHPANVRSGVGLGKRQRLDLLAADGGEEVATPLVLIRGAEDVRGTAPPDGKRPGGAAQLALEQRKRDMVEAPAAKLFGDVRRIESQRLDLPLDLAAQLPGDAAAALDLGFEWIELLLHEAANRVHHQLLLGCQGKVHAPVTAMMRISWSSRQRSSCLTERPLA